MDLEWLGDSSCIQAAGFKAGFLTIQFQDGSIYTYQGVSPQTYVALKRSTSRGYYYNTAIRNNYSFFEGMAPDTGELKYIDQSYFEESALESSVFIE